MIKIIIDGFGGDNAPHEIVGGAVNSVKLNEDIEIILTGKEEILKEELKKFGYTGNRISIVNAESIITNDDIPTTAIKQKKDSSLVVGMEMLKEREDIVGIVSAGSTGAVLAGGLFKVGRIKGIMRPALGPLFPNKNGGKTLLIDCGANVDSKPQFLCQFAIMGTVYMQSMFGLEKPRVALLSNGVEDKKGNELVHQTFEMLNKMEGINFVGNMEAREIMSGDFDVVVCDGFNGNIALKATEGASNFILSSLKKEVLKSGIFAKLGALLLKPVMKKLMADMDYKAIGGSPLLGLEKIVIKAHGSSMAESIYGSVMQVKTLANAKLIDKIKEKLKDINLEVGES